jgi:hypothetical protein
LAFAWRAAGPVPGASFSWGEADAIQVGNH